jgi:hypothetical protein
MVKKVGPQVQRIRDVWRLGGLAQRTWVERGAYGLIFYSDVTESLLLSINFCHCKYWMSLF